MKETTSYLKHEKLIIILKKYIIQLKIITLIFNRERLANYTYVLKFQGNKLSISGSGWHSSSRQAQM